MLSQDDRHQIDTLMRRTSERDAAIAADARLSPGERRAQRARSQLAAEQLHQQILDQADARHQRAVKDAHRRNFGLKVNSADGVLADRDARQFAAGLKTPGAALKALKAADLRGDTSLARAIGEVAWQSRDTDPTGGWADVLTAYASADPARNAALGDYAEILGHDSPGARLADSFYRHLPRPADLRPWGTLESIATSMGDPAVTT